MLSPSFLGRVRFCRGAILLYRCQAGERLRMAFLFLSPAALGLWGRGLHCGSLPCVPFLFLTCSEILLTMTPIWLVWIGRMSLTPQSTSLLTSLLWTFSFPFFFLFSKRYEYLGKKRKKFRDFQVYRILYFNIITLKVMFWLVSVDKNYILYKIELDIQIFPFQWTLLLLYHQK